MANGYYEILGVDRGVSSAEIKRAYRRLARIYHPDVNNGDPTAEQKFKAISEAYAVLNDTHKRRQYDLGGPRAFDWFFQNDTPDIFEIFRQAFGGDPFAQAAGPRRGRSLGAEVTISLAEVLTGTTRMVEYTRAVPCEVCEGTGIKPGSSIRRCATCGGTGQVRQTRNTFLGSLTTVGTCRACRGQGEVVDELCEICSGQGIAQAREELDVEIPVGIEHGQTLIIQGAGDSAPGGRAGDLHVSVRVEPHELFEREGCDLHMHLTISFVQATLGDTLTIPTLQDETELKIPPGTQPGSLLHIRGQGLTQMRSRRRGDLIVHLQVAVPQRLTKRQRELLLQFGEAESH